MDKRIVPFIIMIFLVMSIPVSYGADYGENSTCLGQVVDVYNSDDYVNSTYNVIRNVTLQCMQLNYSEGIDFLDYTVGDSDNDLTVTPMRVDWDTLRRDADAYLYYDFGAGSIADFDWNFTMCFTDIEAGGATTRDIVDVFRVGTGWGSMSDYQSIGDDFIKILARQSTSEDDKFYLRLQSVTDAVADFLDETTVYLISSTPWYMNIARVGDAVSLDIYSDEEHTVLVDSLGGTGNSMGYQYLEPMLSRDQLTDPDDYSTGYVIWNFTTGYHSGHYYTEDMMIGLDGGSLVHLVNTTIPSGTTITVEYSNDNSTWKNHLGDAGSDTLTSGYHGHELIALNYTVLYMRFNLTTTNPLVTPAVCLNRVIATYCAGIGGSTMNLFYPLFIMVIIGAFLGTWVLSVFKDKFRW